jgi:hypothetical protein
VQNYFRHSFWRAIAIFGEAVHCTAGFHRPVKGSRVATIDVNMEPYESK